MKKATIGFRTKTAKAIALALDRDNPPGFVQRWNLELFDPKIPETGQPHHVVMELPWTEALRTVRKYEKAIEDVTTERLRMMLDELRAAGFDVRAIGVVGSPDRNLEKIGNRHIRAHAAEGILFRHAVEIAAERCGIRCRQFSDRGFIDAAPRELGRTSRQIDSALREIAAAAGRPWRVDERTAALAAWIAGARR